MRYLIILFSLFCVNCFAGVTMDTNTGQVFGFIDTLITCIAVAIICTASGAFWAMSKCLELFSTVGFGKR